jgi:putative oxidoreductase
MPIVRRLARPLLAAPLIQSGIQTARHPGPQVEVARPILSQVQEPLRLPADQVQVVRAAGAVTAAAGLLLALGKLPRLSALALVVTAPVVTTVQPFWKEKDPQQRSSQLTESLKSLGLIGGALLAAVDTEGKPSIAYRGRKATVATSDSIASSLHDAQESAVKQGRRARKRAQKAQKAYAKTLDKQTAKASKKAAKVSKKTRQSLPV